VLCCASTGKLLQGRCRLDNFANDSFIPFSSWRQENHTSGPEENHCQAYLVGMSRHATASSKIAQESLERGKTPIGRKIQACKWERGIASIDRIRDRMMPQLVAGHLSIKSCPGQGGCKGRTRAERDCSRSRQNQKNKAYHQLKFPGRMTSSSDAVGAPVDIKVWFGRHTGSPSHGSSLRACPGSFSPKHMPIVRTVITNSSFLSFTFSATFFLFWPFRAAET
jgi:hypothetical protein